MTLRTATRAEIASVIASILIAVWIIVPLYPSNRLMMVVPAVAMLAIVVNSMRVRGETRADIGLTGAHFIHALRLLVVPMIVAIVVLGGIAVATHTFRSEFWEWYKLISIPVWGVVQQFLLQGFVYRRISSLVDDRSRAIGVTAIMFSLIHFPNFPLMILTLIGSLVWTWIYSRAPNILAVGISHGLMSLLVMATLPKQMLPTLTIGYKYFLSQSF